MYLKNHYHYVGEYEISVDIFINNLKGKNCILYIYIHVNFQYK